MIQKLTSLFFILLLLSGSVLAQKTIIVQINTQPESAHIFIDGNELNKEDVPFFIGVGEHEIEIKCIGYLSQITSIKVSKKNFRFSYALKRDESVTLTESVVEPVVNELSAENVISEEGTVPSEVVLASAVLIPKSDYKFEMEMVDVVGGYFLMGHQYGGKKAKVHTVKVPNFMIGKYEVTQAQWVAIMGDNPSKFINENYPVENVSWYDVQVFISKLNEKNEMNYRLPTEAEWEYAARSGQKRKIDEYKFSGSNKLHEVGWNWRNSGDSILVGRWELEMMKKNNSRPHIGGEKKANSLGIYDMSGNLWEWCSDWYSDDYYERSPKENPQGPKATKRRVYRGGSFVSKEKQCRVYYRFSSAPKYAYTYLGFRLVLD